MYNNNRQKNKLSRTHKKNKLRTQKKMEPNHALPPQFPETNMIIIQRPVLDLLTHFRINK